MYVIDIIKVIFYFVLLFICAATDFKNGKIYNKNLINFLIIYAILYVIEYIYVFFANREELSFLNSKLINNLLGFAIAFVIGFIFYLVGIFKGGDAKLIAIVGLSNGMHDMFMHFAVIIIVAGIIALYVLLKYKIFMKRLRRIFLYFRQFTLTRKLQKYKTDNDNIKFPFAVYIFIGELLVYTYNIVNRISV